MYDPAFALYLKREIERIERQIASNEDDIARLAGMLKMLAYQDQERKSDGRQTHAD